MIILILETLCDVVYECMLDSTVKLQIYQCLSYEPQLNASAGGVARLYSIRFDYSPRLPPCPVAICVLTYNVRTGTVAQSSYSSPIRHLSSLVRGDELMPSCPVIDSREGQVCRASGSRVVLGNRVCLVGAREQSYRTVRESFASEIRPSNVGEYSTVCIVYQPLQS